MLYQRADYIVFYVTALVRLSKSSHSINVDYNNIFFTYDMTCLAHNESSDEVHVMRFGREEDHKILTNLKTQLVE